MNRSAIYYYTDTGSARVVPLVLQQLSNDERQFLAREEAKSHNPTYFGSIARMVAGRISNVHAAEAEGYYDICY